MLGRGFFQNLNFSFLGQVFQYYLLGLKVCRLRFASFGIKAQVLKSGLLSLYLLFLVVILSCSFCIRYSLLFFCDVHEVKSCTKFKKKVKKETSEKKRKLKNIVCSFNSLKQKYCFLLSSSFDSLFL